MKIEFIYKVIANVYDLIDAVYFRNYERSPRKAVIEEISENDEILDLCTGTATNAIGIAKARPKTKIVGIDLSGNMLKVARNKVKKAEVENIKLYEMDVTQMDFNSECFDKILISLVLHELDEELASKIITEAKRVLKNNGEIIITEWEPSEQFIKRLLFAPIHYLEPKSYRKFIKEDLYSYFIKFGLQVKKYKHCDYTKVISLRKIKTDKPTDFCI